MWMLPFTKLPPIVEMDEQVNRPTQSFDAA
jgi:hypothetical protein